MSKEKLSSVMRGVLSELSSKHFPKLSKKTEKDKGKNINKLVRLLNLKNK